MTGPEGSPRPIQPRFASREGMEQVIEMGMEQGMVEALGQIDAILGGERA